MNDWKKGEIERPSYYDTAQEVAWEAQKTEALRRYHSAADRRRELALELLAGKADWNPRWPQWVG